MLGVSSLCSQPELITAQASLTGHRSCPVRRLTFYPFPFWACHQRIDRPFHGPKPQGPGENKALSWSSEIRSRSSATSGPQSICLLEVTWKSQPSGLGCSGTFSLSCDGVAPPPPLSSRVCSLLGTLDLSTSHQGQMCPAVVTRVLAEQA